MNKWIVLTTIHRPSAPIDALSRLCGSSDWRCVVVGDVKTPARWQASHIEYLSIDAQREIYPELAAMMPLNHYCRKNLGYLYAAKQGADVILETDDDNILREGFGQSTSLTVNGRLVGEKGWVNVYSHFTGALIWPRGNPLDTIHDMGKVVDETAADDCPVQQFLVDGDPDVDAIHRLLFKRELTFDNRPPVLLERGSWCAFNSQNTQFFKEYFALMYLPCFVSFRMTDIWRSFVAQAVLWSKGKRVSFSGATMVQVRNEHDLMRDFAQEVDGYLGNRKICEVLSGAAETWAEGDGIKSRVLSAWESLRVQGFVTAGELVTLCAWLMYLDD